MAEPFLGEIKIFGGPYAPIGWVPCDGRLLSIAENDALYALIGTTFGGDGQVTFGVPDMRGRVPIGTGNSWLGAMSGSESVNLLATNLPAHNHQMSSNSAVGTLGSPKNGFPAGCTVAAGTPVDTVYEATADAALAPGSLTTAGLSLPHNNVQPSLVLTFIMATAGVFPSRG